MIYFYLIIISIPCATIYKTMGKTFLLYFTLIPFFLSAQVKGDAVIEWLGVKEMSYGKFKVNIPRFSGPSFHYDAAKRAVFYTAKVKDVPYSDENKIQITNVVYDAITLSELGDLASENIPKTTNPTMLVSTSRGVKEAFVSISPLIKDEFGFKRVKSFSYELKNHPKGGHILIAFFIAFPTDLKLIPINVSLILESMNTKQLA